MIFTGKEDHSITLDEARKLTRDFRNNSDKQVVKAHFFGKDILQKILDQKNCVGIRHYQGQNNDSTSVLVLVGVNASGEDMTIGPIAELGRPCPPYCDENSSLNT